MKTRLSFVSRRPSAKPDPQSPRGAKEIMGADEEGPPQPEPLANPEIIPRPSTLGGSSLKDSSSASETGPTSPNYAKSRSKSILDLKKKMSTLSDGGAAEEIGDDGEIKPIFPSSVREGFLKKKGIVNPTWKKRYIVLLPHQLAYYEEKPMSADALPKGFINLASIVKCEHHDPVVSLKDFAFDVVTPTRIFRLQSDTLAGMDAWIASISGTAANEQQILASRRRNVSHAALRTLAEQDRPKVDDSAAISHENAELRQWPTWNAFEVAAWIQTFGMGRYSTDFYNNSINGEKLKTLDDATLVTIGVEEKGDRGKIVANIKKLIQDTKRS